MFLCYSFEKGKQGNSTQRATREEIEVIFMCLCVTLLKKVNSTQRFSFAKETNKKRNWNDIFVFYSFEKGKQYTEIFLCKRYQQEKKMKWYFCVWVLLFWKRETVHRDFLLQRRATREEFEIIFLFLCVTLLKKVNSTQENLCVLLTFFKIGRQI